MFSIKKEKVKPEWHSLGFYRDNWSMFVFIPAAVGGIFQLLHLWSMDPSFVRFFSVDQVIPDGLMFIFISGFIVLSLLWLKKVCWSKEKLKLEWTIQNIWLNVKKPLVVFIALLLFIFFIQYESTGGLESPLLIEIAIRLSLMYVVFLALCILLILRILYFFKDDKNPYETIKNFDESFENVLMSNTFLGAFFYTLLGWLVLLYILHSGLFIYNKSSKFNNLGNEVVLIKAIKKKILIKGNLSLKYYNGKYLFLEEELPSSSRYIVLKGDYLVDLLNTNIGDKN